MRELFAPIHDKLSEYQPEQKYFLIDENRISRLLLAQVKGESAFIFRFEQANSGEELVQIFREFKRALSDSGHNFLKRAVVAWLSRLITKKGFTISDMEVEEDESMLEEKIARWEEELYLKGHKVGVSEGRKESDDINLENQRQLLGRAISGRFCNTGSNLYLAISELNDPVSLGNLIVAAATVKTWDEFKMELRNYIDTTKFNL